MPSIHSRRQDAVFHGENPRLGFLFTVLTPISKWAHSKGKPSEAMTGLLWTSKEPVSPDPPHPQLCLQLPW